ncbi:MAG: endolytic transglycosylase MltG, partial [Candidatus Levybacteria bacterium CG_4_10_14_0_2_um_filter_35_8]
GTLDIWVTIPEGKRTEEVAEILKKNIPTFQQSWIQSLITDEGYLFPDTYLIPKDATIDLISTMMKDNFQQKFDSAKNTKITNLTDRETIIMASLVEREAKADIDRPMVASVIYNRISIDMKLDIDATLQYALGYQTDEKRWWKKELTSQDKTINSPYNTYTNPGLPPGPISNPGLASIKASLNPAKTDYLFYISDANGTNHYAKTMAEHNANIKKYGL